MSSTQAKTRNTQENDELNMTRNIPLPLKQVRKKRHKK